MSGGRQTQLFPASTPTMTDLETTLAVDGQQQLSISNKPNKLLASKLNKVLGSSASDDKVKTALTSLSAIADLDETDLRRNLRGTIEKKEIQVNKKFIEGLGRLVEVCKGWFTKVGFLSHACQEAIRSIGDRSGYHGQRLQQYEGQVGSSTRSNSRDD